MFIFCGQLFRLFGVKSYEKVITTYQHTYHKIYEQIQR